MVARALPVPIVLSGAGRESDPRPHGQGDRSGGYKPMRRRRRCGLRAGLRNIPEVREVVRALKRPVNVVTGWLDPDITCLS